RPAARTRARVLFQESSSTSPRSSGASHSPDNDEGHAAASDLRPTATACVWRAAAATNAKIITPSRATWRSLFTDQYEREGHSESGMRWGMRAIDYYHRTGSN